MIKFNDLYEQYLSIQIPIDKAIKDVIADSSFIGGKYVQKFEEEFASYQESFFSVGVGNGTDALEIAIESLELPPESEIIVPANSFISSAECVVRTNNVPVFCDANPDDYTINIKDLQKRITNKTKAIVAVHLYGHPCNMDEILDVSHQKGIKVVEDCAQAHGSKFKGKKLGSLGDVGCFSFYPGKNLGAYGDGGVITTNNETLAKKCRMIANHGRIDKYNHEFSGRNSRLDGIQAAVLSVKLKYLDQWIEQRNAVADHYIKELSDINSIHLPEKKHWASHAYHLFVIRNEDRNKIIEHLQSRNIQTGIHYPIALPKLKAFQYLSQDEEKGFCWMEDKNLVSLPIGSHLKMDNLYSITNAIKEVV